MMLLRVFHRTQWRLGVMLHVLVFGTAPSCHIVSTHQKKTVKYYKKEMTKQSQSYPEFFKVYIPRNSSQRLHIPPAFVACLNKTVPENTILRSRRGRLWHVKVGKTEDAVFFESGWQNFLIDNSVELGDFLTFKCNDDYVFDVKIFGKFGCEKEEIGTYASIDACVKEEEEEEEEEEEDDDDDDDDDYEGDDDDDDNYDEDEEEEYDDDEKLKAKTSKVQVLGSNTKSCGRNQKKKDSNCEYKGTSSVKFKGASEGTTAVSVEEDPAIEVEQYVQPKNPYFVTRIRPGKRNKLYVPVDVLKDHNLQLPPKVFFLDQKERNWAGKVSLWKDGRTWINGWTAFCKWNRVVVNDSCICEFLRGRGQRGNQIKVHIVRAESQTAKPR